MGKRKKSLYVLAAFAGILFLAVGYLSLDAYLFLNRPGSDQPEEIIFSIAPGATFDRVAWDLKKAGVIADVPRFRLLAQYEDSIHKIRAGDFAVSTGWTPRQVLQHLCSGKAIIYRLTLREGLSWWESARLIEEQGFARFDDLKACFFDREFLDRHHIPFESAEGFLFPETYFLHKPQELDKQQACRLAGLLIETFWKKTAPVWAKVQPVPAEQASKSAWQALPPRLQDLGEKSLEPQALGAALANSGAELTLNLAEALSPEPSSPWRIDPQELRRLLILASLVEKETAVPAERAMVAGVYANRLRQGMRLQCDPTIPYGIGESFSGEILLSHIQDRANPYNTYQYGGLPPGPICSSGLAALQAALEPAEHEYVYFVATGRADEGHTFSKNLSDHNEAVSKYRRTRKLLRNASKAP